MSVYHKNPKRLKRPFKEEKKTNKLMFFGLDFGHERIFEMEILIKVSQTIIPIHKYLNKILQRKFESAVLFDDTGCCL